jgi:hypothetical protein
MTVICTQLNLRDLVHLDEIELAVSAWDAEAGTFVLCNSLQWPQVSEVVGTTLLGTLRQRWPRLGLVPDAALVQLLEELPAVFRCAWALQQEAQHTQPPEFVRLPQPLLDALFRGVNAVVPMVQPTVQPQASSTGDGTVSGCLYTALGVSAAPGQVSACPWEPLSEQELAEGVGCMQIGALVSIQAHTSCNTSTSSSCADVCGLVRGTVLQQLDLSQSEAPAHHQTQVLQLLQQPEHQQEANTGQHGRRRSSAVAASGPQGVICAYDSCPAAVLQALHAAAATALKRQLASALESASAMPVS